MKKNYIAPKTRDLKLDAMTLLAASEDGNYGKGPNDPNASAKFTHYVEDEQ